MNKIDNSFQGELISDEEIQILLLKHFGDASCSEKAYDFWHDLIKAQAIHSEARCQKEKLEAYEQGKRDGVRLLLDEFLEKNYIVEYNLDLVMEHLKGEA